MFSSRIILQLFGFMLLAHSALAIKCFTCDSITDPDCATLSSSSMQAVNCTKKMVALESPLWLRQIISIIYFEQHEQYDPMKGLVCQKIIGREAGQEITVRTCQLDAADTDPCDVAKLKLKERNMQSAEIVSCSVCKTDQCNTASQLSISLSFGLLITLLSLGLRDLF